MKKKSVTKKSLPKELQIQSFDASILKNRPKLMCSITGLTGIIVKRAGHNNTGNVATILDPFKLVSHYLQVNFKKLHGIDIDILALSALKAYEELYSPLEGDGRKAIIYDKVRVDNTSGASDFFDVHLDRKNNAMKRLKDCHFYLDSFVDNYTGMPFGFSELAYSKRFSFICEGFKGELNACDILTAIGQGGKNDNHKTSLHRGTWVVHESAKVMSGFFNVRQGGKNHKGWQQEKSENLTVKQKADA